MKKSIIAMNSIYHRWSVLMGASYHDPVGNVHCVVCTCSVLFTVCSVQCTVCSYQCAVCSVQCAGCSVQYAVCSGQCAVGSGEWTVESGQWVVIAEGLGQPPFYWIPRGRWPQSEDAPNLHIFKWNLTLLHFKPSLCLQQYYKPV